MYFRKRECSHCSANVPELVIIDDLLDEVTAAAAGVDETFFVRIC
jgi:hypothetical protein